MTTLPEEAVKAADIIQVITDLRLAILQDDDEGLAEHAEPMVKAKELIAKLSASPYLSVQGVVKKLEWQEERGLSSFGSTFKSAARTIGYRIFQQSPKHKLRFLVTTLGATSHPDNIVCEADSIEAAKAAAQADYEARILSALEPSAARELALEEAAQWLDDWSAKTMGQDVSPEYAAAAIRALSSPDHADAGKVEGEGWLPTHPSLPKKGRFLAVATGEIERIAWNDPAAVVTVKAFDGPFVCYVHEDGAGFTDEFGEVYRADGVVIDAEDLTAADDVLRLTRWRPLPSAPASEGAE